MTKNHRPGFFESTLNIFSEILSDNIYIYLFQLRRKPAKKKEDEVELRVKLDDDINQGLIKLITKYNSFCSYYFNVINNIGYENIYIKSTPNHFIKIFKAIGIAFSGEKNTEFLCSLCMNVKNTNSYINSISVKEFIVENVLIRNFLNNLIFQNNKEVDLINLKLVSNNNLCNMHLSAIKSIRTVNKKLLSVFCPSTNNVYFPPIMDEVIPICNSIVELACKYLNNSNPSCWSIQILVWISSLLRISYYNGVFQILTTMVSVLKNNSLNYSIAYGVFPYLWEGLLDMFLLLDQEIAKSLINILKNIPICGIVFKSDISKRFFIEERINLFIKFQDKLSNKVRDVETKIGKLLDSKNFQNEMSRNDHFDQFRYKNCNSIQNYRFLDQNIFIKHYNSKLKHKPYNTVKCKREFINQFFEDKYDSFRNFGKLKLNSRLISGYLEFKVIRYENSILTLNAAFNNKIFRKGDLILIQPFNKQIKIHERQIMSFRQLAIVLNVIFIKQSLNLGGKTLTLKLKIIDPGIDPSIYKHCVIIYLLNYYKYKKKTTLIKRYSFKFPHPYLSLIENTNREIFEKLIYNSYNGKNEDNNNKLMVVFSEKLKNIYLDQEIEIKWILFRQEIFNFNSCSFSNKRKELFSYLLKFPGIDCNIIKKLLYLTEIQKHIILLALNSIAMVINNINYNHRINLISMITFCKKTINPNSKIIIIVSRFEYARMIKHTLHTLNIYAKILEEEYLLFKSEHYIKTRTHNINFKELPGYENWLNRETIIEECDIIIINNIEINYKFVKKNFNNEKKSSENLYLNHLFIENIGVLSKLDILLLFILPFNSITLFNNEFMKER
ncbi:uncharacterized protein cubi_02948 [Cryptosporidium ubiquitum]|uniref:Uncharacterized protein n=1 Tax=Cryptosporidium ubiquitum TaxID=857276 RepID=A0A1J4MIQ6_9CRYT|nr:uncharacterized protein cubi_02948 [Cryptosporidium ubiquitum]OII74146.1 hypothetical protein cubi_02948 [Cryptosporidium ubiquitum]